MRHALTWLALFSAIALGGCATAPAPDIRPTRLRLDEVVALSKGGLGDEALVAEMDKRGVAFVLSPQDFEQQRAAGVSEGLLRYLQGRADGEQALKILIVSGRHQLDAYSGAVYLGSGYLGYYDGLHYYGEYGGARYGVRYGGHVGGHRGRHGGHGRRGGGRH